MTRNEHIKWCKDRAILEYEYYRGDKGIQNALISMMSDLKKHDETKNHAGIELAGMMLMTHQLRTEAELRKFIDGFN